jgi:mannose-6-phosphate isomerase-like protein (cupin superfamily)
MGTITPDNAVTVMQNAPVPRFKTRLAMATHACAHAYDHYGQLVEYLRTNGIVPPASRPQPSPTASETSGRSGTPQPLILQEGDGEHRVRRPITPTTNHSQAQRNASVPFTIKVDERNGNAQDFSVVTSIEPPGNVFPFHMHHNAEEILILEEGGATVTVGDKRAVAGPRSIVFIPRETWVSVAFTGTQPVHVYALFSRQGFEQRLRAYSVLEGEPVMPISAEERARLPDLGHATYWDTSKGPSPPMSKTARDPAAAQQLILHEGDGEHRVRRPVAPGFGETPRKAGVPFTIKVDERNGNAQDFLVVTEIEPPGHVLQFHMHHNSEELLILEEGGATVTVGDKRAVAGPRSIVFIPRETWVSVAFTGTQPTHVYALFARQGFEQLLRGASVLEGQPVTPLSPDERTRLRETGHATYWDTSKGPYPPGVAHP